VPLRGLRTLPSAALSAAARALLTNMVEEALAYVQGESLKANAVF
jgi:hypothetical protein